MKPYARLTVVWADPVHHRRYSVGELWRLENEQGFAFGYSELSEAESSGFNKLPEFPIVRRISDPYMSRELFSTFAQRIPSSQRLDYQQILRSWGVSSATDPFEILALSGGVLNTDRLELCEYRPLDDELQRPLFFRVSGERHFEGATMLHDGDLVDFEREPTNEVDRFATYVLVIGGQKVGWVPRQYSQLIASHLDRGHDLEARAMHRLVLPSERDRWVVSVTRRPQMPRE